MRDVDDVCEVTLPVVGVADTGVLVADAEGAAEEGVEITADGELSDGVAAAAADGLTVAEAGLGAAPVPRGTLARCCSAISISLTALTPYSKVASSNKRGMTVVPSIMRRLARKLMISK